LGSALAGKEYEAPRMSIFNRFRGIFKR